LALAFNVYPALLQAAFILLLYGFSAHFFAGIKTRLLSVFVALFAGDLSVLAGVFQGIPFNLNNWMFFDTELWNKGFAFNPNLMTILDSRPFIMGFVISLVFLQLF